MMNQLEMKRIAEAHCRDRSEREGVPCYVFINRSTETWYVVTDAQEKPKNAELVWAWPLMQILD